MHHKSRTAKYYYFLFHCADYSPCLFRYGTYVGIGVGGVAAVGLAIPVVAIAGVSVS